MNDLSPEINRKFGLNITDFITEPDGKQYNACQFKIDGRLVICRTAKITPKKIGQFVSFWKRNSMGKIRPFSEEDDFNFYFVYVNKDGRTGRFFFPKSILIAHGIVSTLSKDGKRGFRVYPIWDTTTTKQAKKTQQWQLKYFYETQQTADL